MFPSVRLRSCVRGERLSGPRQRLFFRLRLDDLHALEDVAWLALEKLTEPVKGIRIDVLHLLIFPPAARGHRRHVHGHLKLVGRRETSLLSKLADQEDYHAREYSTGVFA